MHATIPLTKQDSANTRPFRRIQPFGGWSGARKETGVERQLALLRGVNLGAHNRVGMAELRATLAELGYARLSTHLQSGNAVFSAATPADRTAARIRASIESEFGLDVPVLVRTATQLRAVLAADPFGSLATDESRYLVQFLDAEPDSSRLAALDEQRYEPERYELIGRELYLWLPGGVHKSRLEPALRRIVGVGTARNWRTLRRLLELLES
jgi:uncharacterized protein (DUF1697 family)